MGIDIIIPRVLYNSSSQNYRVSQGCDSSGVKATSNAFAGNMEKRLNKVSDSEDESGTGWVKALDRTLPVVEVLSVNNADQRDAYRHSLGKMGVNAYRHAMNFGRSRE